MLAQSSLVAFSRKEGSIMRSSFVSDSSFSSDGVRIPNTAAASTGVVCKATPINLAIRLGISEGKGAQQSFGARRKQGIAPLWSSSSSSSFSFSSCPGRCWSFPIESSVLESGTESPERSRRRCSSIRSWTRSVTSGCNRGGLQASITVGSALFRSRYPLHKNATEISAKNSFLLTMAYARSKSAEAAFSVESSESRSSRIETAAAAVVFPAQSRRSTFSYLPEAFAISYRTSTVWLSRPFSRQH
mmetsp:Transcript_27050/g.63293  ORF Transcript_27050/g.63293 Transcript_27050/m.63293 type:complete len:245 (+) Transcript_27050:266-1000(+)